LGKSSRALTVSPSQFHSFYCESGLLIHRPAAACPSIDEVAIINSSPITPIPTLKYT